MRRHTTAAVLALTLAIGVGSLLPPVVRGTDTSGCVDGLVNRWSGIGKWFTTPDGAYAQVDRQTLNMCNTPGPVELSASFAFSNVQGPNGWDIVQIGMGQCREPFACTSGMHVYTGWGRANSSPGCSGWTSVSPHAFQEQTAWPTTGPIAYKVYHTGNNWNLYQNSTLVYQVPETWLCWTANAATWFAESWDYGDAIGGTATNKLYFVNMKYATTEGGAWTSTAWNATGPCNIGGAAPFFCDVVSGTSISAWTSR